MQYNVAQLLKEPIGSTRSYQVGEVFRHAGRFADQVTGPLRLLKTHQGLLANAELIVEASQNCGRCLSEYPVSFTMVIEEECFPVLDINTGRRSTLPPGSEGVGIDDNHLLDLTEVLRQYVITYSPMKPLCHTNCLGLCQQCGANLNESACSCGVGSVDPRWLDLTQLLQQQG